LRIDSSVAHALALSGFPVYVASSRLGSIQLTFLSVFGFFAHPRIFSQANTK
jgi:hypothetical protein